MITQEHLVAVSEGLEKPNKTLQDIINLSPSYMKEEDIMESVFCAISGQEIEDWTEQMAYAFLQTKQPFNMLKQLGVLEQLIKARRHAFEEVAHLTHMAIGYEHTNNTREVIQN
jgi:hypothetical protein